MSTENAKIKIRNRTVELKWVSQYCDHVMDNYMHRNKDHNVKFLEIARLLKTCSLFKQDRGRIWYGLSELNGKQYKVIFILTPKFAVVKTCYRYGHKEN